MKKLLLVLVMLMFTLSCSIDDMEKQFYSTFSTEYVDSSTQHPWGGYYVYFYVDSILTDTIFLSNGADGVDGKDGINGIDGIDGEDGVSVTMRKECIDESEEFPDGGCYLYITTIDGEVSIFFENGADGTNGADGLDGTDGTDGVNVIIKTVKVEGGYILYITDINGTTQIFIENGEDGSNGLDGTNGTNGEDGEDGEDLTNGDGTVTICHKVTHGVNEHPEWGSNTTVTLTLTLSEYIEHIYEFHNGNSSQNDSFGECK